MLILQCYCSPCHPIIMLLRRRVTWRPLLVGTEMPLLRGCDLMTVIHAVMMMREGEDVPAWLMIHAAVCLQARGSCLHCPRKTLTGGTPTWCKLTLFFFLLKLRVFLPHRLPSPRIGAHDPLTLASPAGSSRTARATCGAAPRPRRSRVRARQMKRTACL